jgi:dihydrofolate reductase
MKITLAIVTSIDGKTTKGSEENQDTDISEWTSYEDKDYFNDLVQRSQLIIMGRKTFEAAEKRMKLSERTLYLIMTKEPGVYRNKTVVGQLEFTAAQPETLTKELENRGFKEALLVGGANVTSAFLRSNLVDEIWLTLEPKLFGIGKGLVSPEELDVDLKLESLEKLNEKGTLLLKYQVNK